MGQCWATVRQLARSQSVATSLAAPLLGSTFLASKRLLLEGFHACRCAVALLHWRETGNPEPCVAVSTPHCPEMTCHFLPSPLLLEADFGVSCVAKRVCLAAWTHDGMECGWMRCRCEVSGLRFRESLDHAIRTNRSSTFRIAQ